MNLIKERHDLEQLQQEVTELEDGVHVKKAAAIQAEERAHLLQTPAGLAEASDKDIEGSLRNLRDSRRALGLAEAVLKEFTDAGPAKDLEKRFKDLQRREHEATLSTKIQAYEEWLSAHLEHWGVVRASELEGEKLAAAAERRPFPRIANSVLAGAAAELTPFDSLCDAVCEMGLTRLLPPDSPRRKYFERLRRPPDRRHAEAERVLPVPAALLSRDVSVTVTPRGAVIVRDQA